MGVCLLIRVFFFTATVAALYTYIYIYVCVCARAHAIFENKANNVACFFVLSVFPGHISHD